MKTIAIIPARSGSKGLKDKNIKLLNGKPLLVYSIEAAKASGIFDIIHVSTDSEEYAGIAREYGADVPFLRDESLSGDTASSWDAVRFVLDKYHELGKDFEEIALLQPTSPLRTKDDIIESYNCFTRKKCKAVIGVCKAEISPLNSGQIASDGNMAGFIEERHRHKRRQEQPDFYRINGAIYIISKECLDNIPGLYDDECYAYVMDRKNSIDIDDELDFMYAEMIMKNSLKSI